MKFFKYLLITALSLVATEVLANKSPTANLRGDVILKGRDPVSYFQSGGPVRGRGEFFVIENGIRYLFANELNRQEFINHPDQYRPEYEGWCAIAVAGGYKYDIDPEAFVINEGRLFLFYRSIAGDTRKDWLADQSGSVKKADANWPTVKYLPNP